MTPYYSDESVTIYHGDCRDVLPGIDSGSVALVLTDPPYGVNERTDRRSKGRSALAAAHDFPPVHGDDEPFDPSLLLRFPRLVLFGANYFAERLPASSSWVVWDKVAGLDSKREVGFNDNADVELAWTNLGGPARLVPHRWMGLIRESEHSERRLHPTQKPVALMAKLIERYTNPGDLILDPYMGSGSTLRAAKDCGRRAIGVEYEAAYCEVAARRMGQEVLDFGGAA